MEDFQKSLNRTKEPQPRAATAIDTEDWIVRGRKMHNTEFVGYNDLLVETNVTKYIRKPAPLRRQSEPDQSGQHENILPTRQRLT